MQQKGQLLCYSETIDSVLCKPCLLTAKNSAFSVHSASCDVAMCVTNSKSHCHLRFDETGFRPVDRTSLDHNRLFFLLVTGGVARCLLLQDSSAGLMDLLWSKEVLSTGPRSMAGLASEPVWPCGKALGW